MANIKAYIYGTTGVASSGDYSRAIDCGPTYIGEAGSSATPFVVKVDTSGFSRVGNYVISLVGNHASRYALSATSAASGFGAFGAPLTLSGATINTTGVTVWLKKKAILGDTLGVTGTRAQISLPQDNITSG